MEKKRLLLITQEMEPYTEGNDISALVGKLPKFLQDNGYELRILMPRYGVVNERRHRLHEVVRLSGMNIIVDDDDYPLLIKVASRSIFSTTRSSSNANRCLKTKVEVHSRTMPNE